MTNNKYKALSKLSAGDIILYRGTGWLSRAIRFFMNKYRKRLGLDERILYNHAAMIIDYDNDLYVAEANEKGIEIASFKRTYFNRTGNIKIITPKKAYTVSEKEIVSKAAISNAFQPTRYDFFNFWFQIKMIRKTTKEGYKDWDGPTGEEATNRLYCTEAVATWANKVRPNTFDKPWSINPLDIDLNNYYKVKYNGVEA